jgi:hypothetical protein
MIQCPQTSLLLKAASDQLCHGFVTSFLPYYHTIPYHRYIMHVMVRCSLGYVYFSALAPNTFITPHFGIPLCLFIPYINAVICYSGRCLIFVWCHMTWTAGGVGPWEKGVSNVKLRCHLPLIVPTNDVTLCGMRVGHQSVPWLHGVVLYTHAHSIIISSYHPPHWFHSLMVMYSHSCLTIHMNMKFGIKHLHHR